MKYLVILGDGMADYPVPELGGATPLMKAFKPNIDRMSEYGELGLVKTVPDHLNPPGSDIANMSVLGYDPDKFYSGRSPLEAVSMGIKLGDEDLAVRCNLVCLSDDEPYEQKTMLDYSSDEITTAESKVLIEYINEKLGTPAFRFYPGISYRHCIVMNVPAGVKLLCTPPHDITERQITGYLPKGFMSDELLACMKKSYELLTEHPINKARVARGLKPANSIWPWGEGRRPSLSDFHEKYGLRGAVVSAVDLVRGLGICAGMKSIVVEGATGTYKTNFEGKADAAVRFLLDGGDFVYIHMEGPDECGHRHEIPEKILSIEYIDARVVGPIEKALRDAGEDFRMLILPDHPTPLVLRTHTHDAVPYIIYDSRQKFMQNPGAKYDENFARLTGVYVPEGHKLMDRFIEGGKV
ncbi:MAG: cofactor-independent phosphoglycerate mutase [Clostridia bacterium]|nr:cofactor-independent phosphoglycerate mutase [Clostridia bacterium]MBP5665706.1 cofactor-independent phosphoglycerate mutase [Clostridia bacterium]